MKSEPDSTSNGNKSKAFIREKYLMGEIPTASYVGAALSVEELKQKYGSEQYRKIGRAINDILNRPNKGPAICKRMHA